MNSFFYLLNETTSFFLVFRVLEMQIEVRKVIKRFLPVLPYLNLKKIKYSSWYILFQTTCPFFIEGNLNYPGFPVNDDKKIILIARTSYFLKILA